jgi:adenine deaminase
VALSQVIAQGGGYAAFDGLTQASLRLQLAGLMSDLPLDELAQQERVIRGFVVDMGCALPSPFMTLSFQDPRFRRAVLGVNGYLVQE